MSFETFHHTKPVPVPGPIGLIPYIVIPLVIGRYTIGLSTAFFFMVIIVLIASGVRRGLATSRWHRSYTAARQDFIKRGYKVDFEHDPRLMIDVGQRKAAVINPAEGSYDVFDLSDILAWEHAWQNSNKHTTNSRGDITSSRIVHKNNRLILETRNPNRPRYEFPIGNHATGTEWKARLSALLKG